MKKKAVTFFVVMLFVFQLAASGQEMFFEVPFVPTPEKVVAVMINMGDVGKDDVLYDLGCGDGRIVITAAAELGTHGVGIDIDPERIRECRENAVKADVVDKVSFYEHDLFDADISDATVITLYLLTNVNIRLRPKILREVKPGTRIVSHNYAMGEWEPDLSCKVNGEMNVHTVYYWVVPADVSGTWEWAITTESGTQKYVLTCAQEFQKFRGTVTLGDNTYSAVKTKLCGAEMQFTMKEEVDGHEASVLYEGTVNGNIIVGSRELGTEQVKHDWKAIRNSFTTTPIER